MGVAYSLLVSVLFNESKLLKSNKRVQRDHITERFSTLQRVEIAEMCSGWCQGRRVTQVSVLFNESKLLKYGVQSAIYPRCAAVSVLFNESKLLKCQRYTSPTLPAAVSVLFNESKLLKCRWRCTRHCVILSFSTLQRVEIAEIRRRKQHQSVIREFQYSSTSRNC